MQILKQDKNRHPVTIDMREMHPWALQYQYGTTDRYTAI